MKEGRYLTAALVALLIIALGGAGYLLYALRGSEAELAGANARIGELVTRLGNAETDMQTLSEALDAERRKNDDFQEQIDDISDTVGKLDKLSKIDPQLLAKYSKVYFLSENYVPAKLSQIPQQFIANSEDKYFVSQALPFLDDLIDDARGDDVNLTIVSAYRSFDEQKQLKAGYQVMYGTGANTFSADQGYSEHQLGTAVDFSTKETNGVLDGFQNTAAYAWLLKNAYKYGFVISYPSGNAYYQYEPWHWRFVGKKLARNLHDDGKNFYDLDQRDIDKYLINLFDK